MARARAKGQKSGAAGLVFTAYNKHTEHCGSPPGLRNTDTPGLYHGYFENRHGEQFVLTFDRATKTGTVSGGDLHWGKPISFTLGLVEAALQATQRIAAEIIRQGQTEATSLPVIDAAMAPGRLTGMTSKDEVNWLRACLEACIGLTDWPGDQRTA